MAARHLVADGDFALLCNINADKFMNAGGEFVLVFAAENANVNNNAALAVRNTQGGVANLARLFAENCPEQAFLGGELRLALGRDFADKDVAGMNLRIRMMPRSSRSFSASSPTLGISRVISSAPSCFVSRASVSCSSIWSDV